MCVSSDVGEPVLKQIDLVIPPRAKVGVVGRTGAGKSTVMLAVLRVCTPSVCLSVSLCLSLSLSLIHHFFIRFYVVVCVVVGGGQERARAD